MTNSIITDNFIFVDLQQENQLSHISHLLQELPINDTLHLLPHLTPCTLPACHRDLRYLRLPRIPLAIHHNWVHPDNNRVYSNGILTTSNNIKSLVHHHQHQGRNYLLKDTFQSIINVIRNHHPENSALDHRLTTLIMAVAETLVGEEGEGTVEGSSI